MNDKRKIYTDIPALMEDGRLILGRKDTWELMPLPEHPQELPQGELRLRPAEDRKR